MSHKRTVYPNNMLRCNKCGQIKPMEQFPVNSKCSTGRSSPCKECRNRQRKMLPVTLYRRERDRQRAIRRRSDPRFPIWRKSYVLRKQYGLTFLEFQQLKEVHNNRCAICGTQPEPRNLHIDHVHGTKKVRGLLCSNCNAGVGQFRDDPLLLIKAAQYLMDFADRDSRADARQAG